MVKLLLVDDSSVIRTMLKHILGKHPQLEIIGEATNGEEAVEKNRLLKPDVIIMDIYMPVLDGIEATRRIMKERPTSILVFSTEDTARMGYVAMEAGAKDMIKKPDVQKLQDGFYDSFMERIIAIAGKSKTTPSAIKTAVAPSGRNWSALLIGASTGGPVAVQKVLSGLGRNFPLPILITQHIDSAFDKHYASWLSETTGMPVELAVNGCIAKKGHAYVAPADYHMEIEKTGGELRFRLVQSELVHFLRPAVDVMFKSAAGVLADSCLAVLLTGMGKDGAAGCVDIVKAGGYTVAESEETCVVFGMPKAAIDMGAASAVLPLDQIPVYVNRIVKGV